MNTRFKRTLLGLVFAATSLSSAAESPEDIAFMVKFVQLNSQSLRLATKGDDDGLVSVIQSLKELEKTPKISTPCMETVQAQIALLSANVAYLRADEDKEGPYLNEIGRLGPIVKERRQTCLNGRMDP